MNAFLASLVFVVLAEMGDKTQLLAMAFACKFRWQTVMWAVLVATAANHLLAAAVGNYLVTVVPLAYIRTAAAASFIIFGLWTLRGDTLRGEDKRYHFSPFWTVTTGFFMAEMGDKTQLATISLAIEYNTVITVWMGTTLGMVISNAFGIIVGNVMGRRIPERFIKWMAALVFIAFGVYELHESLPERVWSPPVIAISLLVLAAAMYVIVRFTAKKVRDVPYCDAKEVVPAGEMPGSRKDND